MNANRTLRLILSHVAALGCAAGAVAQETKPAPPPAEPPAAQAPAQPPSDPKPPSLDDLLGIPKEKPGPSPTLKPRPEAIDPTRSELDRKLAPGQIAEQFKQAIDLMGETADRLQTSKDTGLATQRLQEDIIRKLDQLIKAAEQNQQQSKSKSQSKRDQQQPQPQPNQQQRNPDAKEAAPDTMDPPAQEKAAPNPGTAAHGVAWGSLPERLRDALIQGRSDKYSALYQKWTEAYYRRLAEEANK